MQKYGGKKYHRLFSKEFVRFMIKDGFEIEEYSGANFLFNKRNDKYTDLINSHPTSAGRGFKGKYPIWIGGGYNRIINSVENKSKEVLKGFPEINNFYSTLRPINSVSKKVDQTEDGVEELLRLWKESIYPQIVENLHVFMDMSNLNIIFNYPDKATELGYDEIMNVERVGPRGKVRALSVAREAGDKGYDALLIKYIDEYENMYDPKSDNREIINEIIRRLKMV